CGRRGGSVEGRRPHRLAGAGERLARGADGRGGGGAVRGMCNSGKPMDAGTMSGLAIGQGRHCQPGRRAYLTAQLCHLPSGEGKGPSFIQALLWHSSSKTTEIYTHVSTKALGKIRSPLDELDLE